MFLNKCLSHFFVFLIKKPERIVTDNIEHGKCIITFHSYNGSFRYVPFTADVEVVFYSKDLRILNTFKCNIHIEIFQILLIKECYRNLNNLYI